MTDWIRLEILLLDIVFVSVLIDELIGIYGGLHQKSWTALIFLAFLAKF